MFFGLYKVCLSSTDHTDVKHNTRHTFETISTYPFFLLLHCLQIYTDSHPGMIVLGVTPGYALKLKNRISNKGNFIDPGSAGECLCALAYCIYAIQILSYEWKCSIRYMEV